jgi:methionyl-tRNA synthetase
MTDFITTAISYVNGSPHIGHLYEIILADFIKKVHSLKNKTILQTGTDEHGKKIEKSALLNNIDVKEFCDINSKKFKDLYDNFKINYDYFVRTSDDKHKQFVKDSIIKASNDIYLGNYEGYYNIREETFIPKSEAEKTNYIDILSNTPYEIMNESSYFFKLSNHLEAIYKIISNVYPKEYQKDLLNKLDNGLNDLSISRKNIKWGIEMPNDPSHTVYVWFDALLNYNSKVDTTNFNIYHLIGKDILWFHSVIYPAILSSCDYNLGDKQRKILVHGFINDENGIKMSKSLNNVISIEDLNYTQEAIRYYFLKNTILGNDLNFSKTKLELDYSYLVNSYGNLLQRLYKMLYQYQEEINNLYLNMDDELNNMYNELDLEYNNLIDNFIENHNFKEYFDFIDNLNRKCNKIIVENELWKLNKNEKVYLLTKLLVILNITNKLMIPVIPSKQKEIEMFNLSKHNKLLLENIKFKMFILHS